MPENDAWDLGGGGESFAYDHIGDEVEGFITDAVTRQGTNMKTGEPEWWDKERTRPKLITLVTLQTNLKDNPKDSGLRVVTLAGSKKPNPDGTMSRMCAARTAVLAATGGTAMEPGAWFKMRFSSEGPRTQPGFNPPKGFEAWYRSPVHDLDGQDRTPPSGQISQSTQAGANWPSSNQAAPAWSTDQVNTTTGEIRQTPVTAAQMNAGNALMSGALTLAQVEGVRALVGDDGVANVFGADWKSRVQG